MSRPNREDEPNAVFHVTARINWQYWHLAPESRAKTFLDLLRESAARFGMDVLAYVLMSNHYHFVARSPRAPRFRELTLLRTKCRHRVPAPPGSLRASVLSQFMHRLMYRVSRRFQRELGLSGRFWDDVYHSRRVQDANDLVATIAYDHLNPVREKMVRRPEEYGRSSAAWLHEQVETPLPLCVRKLPFGWTLAELRDSVRRCEEDREFGIVMARFLADGQWPDSEQLRVLLMNTLPRLAG